ncbi:MAG: hypothetical protein UT09_C0034G0008, partial [Parcubacteria group bacterium GW2011_GWF2_38_8]
LPGLRHRIILNLEADAEGKGDSWPWVPRNSQFYSQTIHNRPNVSVPFLFACPADAFKSNAVICRASAGICDVEESCTGAGPECPADDFEPHGVVCREADGLCRYHPAPRRDL